MSPPNALTRRIPVKARMFRIAVALALLAASLTSAAAPAAMAASPGPLAQKMIFFAADGMRPDLMERYAGMGLMPTYADLMA